jgi:signal transduction histidine kinase/CheY-like chemotaxis protein
VSVETVRLTQKITKVLNEYATRSEESALLHAYEVGRESMQRESGILGFVSAYRDVLAAELAETGASDEILRLTRAWGDVLVEGLGPFEMAHEGYREANASLEKLNQALRSENAERRRAEADLAAAKGSAEQANLAKSMFLSRMSHELRTPLNAILGFSQLLDMADLEADHADDVRRILVAGRHLLELINELLDIGRIEAGELTMSPEPVGVADALSDALELIRPLADARSIRVSMDDRVDGHHVQADRQRLKQVLLNLLSNAVKYNTEGGHVTLTCSETAGGMLRIGVSDTGPGITPAEMERVFAPFDRLGRQDGDVEGTGLGLMLSKGLMEAMDGHLDVESVPGEGSTFTIELPLVESPLALLDAYPLGSVEDHTPLDGQHTILYIEDNLSNLKLIERLFERRPQVRLLSTMQATQGIELARQHLPALILLDLHLPDMGGEEALRRLRADPLTKQIPVIVVSADATSSNTRRLLQAGAFDYLTKPLDMARFLDVIDMALHQTRGDA